MCGTPDRLIRRIRLLVAMILCALLAGAAPASGDSSQGHSIQDVKAAVERAKTAVYQNSGLQPNYGTTAESAFLAHMRYSVPQELRNMMGNHALISWALLASGESYQNPKLTKRVHWVLSCDQSSTYDRGMRLSMLATLPQARCRPWIQRDAKWMINAMTDRGNFTNEWFGSKLTGYGDNANGQYGTWGLWVYQRAGYSLPKKDWKKIDSYWRQAQLKTDTNAAGWAVISAKAQEEGESNGIAADERASGPMTAGGVATLCFTERYLKGHEMAKPGKTHVSRHLRKGIRWLDENFSLDDPAERSDPYYYYWTMQRVGAATGYRSFNGIDLRKQITATMLDRQESDGTWSGPKGRLLSTGFALLYLSRTFEPVAVGKLRFVTKDKAGEDDLDAWNNRPHDIWNFVEHISDEYEHTTGWQIVDLNLPVSILIESPILFMATDKRFAFTEAQVDRLRSYINAGGLLVSNVDQANVNVARSFKDLAKALYPHRKLEKVSRDHELYSIYHKVRPSIVMQTITNGVRPLWIHFFKDMGAGLQTNDHKRSESFKIMSNIYLYATGKRSQRQSSASNYIVRRTDSAKRSVGVARIIHEGAYDPEPGAIVQLANLLANEHNIDLAAKSLLPKDLGKEQKIAFLTTQGDGELTDETASQIRKWLKAGGTLWIDAAGGSAAAAENAKAMLAKLAGDAKPLPLPLNHPVISGAGLGNRAVSSRWLSYRPYALKDMGPVNVSRLQGVEIDGRVAIIFSTHDLTSGLAGIEHWGIYGYSVKSARDLATNSILWVAK